MSNALSEPESLVESKEEERKRIIRVGFINPKEDYRMDKDTIYVSLRNYGTDEIAANVISGEDFTYNQQMPGGSVLELTGKQLSTECATGREGMPIINISHTELIKMLTDLNNGEVRYRFLVDGLRLRSALEKTKGLASII